LKLLAVINAGLFTGDHEIESDCLWAFSYIADTHDDSLIEAMASSQNVARIASHLESKEADLFIPAMRCMGNVLTCNDPKVVDRCVFEGCIEKMHNLLLQSNSSVIKETLWGFSNLTAGNSI